MTTGVSISEISVLVLNFLNSNGFKSSYKAFKKESSSYLKNFIISKRVKPLDKILNEYINLSLDIKSSNKPIINSFSTNKLIQTINQLTKSLNTSINEINNIKDHLKTKNSKRKRESLTLFNELEANNTKKSKYMNKIMSESQFKKLINDKKFIKGIVNAINLSNKNDEKISNKSMFDDINLEKIPIPPSINEKNFEKTDIDKTILNKTIKKINDDKNVKESIESIFMVDSRESLNFENAGEKDEEIKKEKSVSFKNFNSKIDDINVNIKEIEIKKMLNKDVNELVDDIHKMEDEGIEKEYNMKEANDIDNKCKIRMKDKKYDFGYIGGCNSSKEKIMIDKNKFGCNKYIKNDIDKKYIKKNDNHKKNIKDNINNHKNENKKNDSKYNYIKRNNKPNKSDNQKIDYNNHYHNNSRKKYVYYNNSIKSNKQTKDQNHNSYSCKDPKYKEEGEISSSSTEFVEFVDIGSE